MLRLRLLKQSLGTLMDLQKKIHQIQVQSDEKNRKVKKEKQTYLCLNGPLSLILPQQNLQLSHNMHDRLSSEFPTRTSSDPASTNTVWMRMSMEV
jgi:hypothetical protein